MTFSESSQEEIIHSKKSKLFILAKNKKSKLLKKNVFDGKIPTPTHTTSKNDSFLVEDSFDDSIFNRSHRFSSMNISNKTNSSIISYSKTDNDSIVAYDGKFSSLEEKKAFKVEIVWRNIFIMILLHVFGFYGWYLCILYAQKKTYIWAYLIANLGGMGVLAGAHRLWTHRSYKAHWSLRIALMIMQTIALQNDIYEWARDHRLHHKFSETNADPHNSRRGFFFAHVGWLLCRKHPEVKEKGSQIDMSDVWADPIVRFQRRFYIPLVLIFWGFFPVLFPYYFWNEELTILIFGNFFRYFISLHHAWLVNSAAHIYGYRPYDKSIRPRENYLVAYLSLGEGYHNYHHTFPWDYSASEHGWMQSFNVATAFIDFCAWLGLATDRRVVPRAVVEKRASRTGDTSLSYKLTNLKAKKPIYVMIEFIFAMIIISWPLWITFILSNLYGKKSVNF